MENNKCIIKEILPKLISFVKNPFDKYNIKEHASIINSISDLTGKNINYSFVKNNEGNIFLCEIYKTILKYMRYFDENIYDTILTLNYIFGFPIQRNVMGNFNICHEIHKKRYFLYERYILLHLFFCEDIVNFLIIKMLYI